MAVKYMMDFSLIERNLSTASLSLRLITDIHRWEDAFCRMALTWRGMRRKLANAIMVRAVVAVGGGRSCVRWFRTRKNKNEMEYDSRYHSNDD